MIRSLLLSLLLFCGLSSPPLEPVVAAKTTAHVSLADARKVALARVPGTIVAEKLKKKKHDHPIYSIKIHPTGAAKGALKKVEIDGDTAKVIKVKDVAAKSKKSEE